ncbi:MAG: Rrf2 family transcriptional regulator [Actinomycetota bacterium]|nr:Rrf2 family transcriptional regulator [Actinomycetota bacterium]
MTLSKRGDYVVRSAISLARAFPHGQSRKIRQVVAEMDVPATFASQILSDLVKAGIATSKAGKDGGYRLARAPEQIRLLDVVEAGEGPLRAERCALGNGPCRWGDVCPLHETWQAATAALREVLATTTLAELLENDRALEAGTYAVPSDSHRHALPVVDICDTVQVEATAADCTALLASSEGWIAEVVQESYATAESSRSRLDPAGAPWLARVAVSVSVTASPEGGDGSGAAMLSLAWEAVGASHLASRLEGTLTVSELDARRGQLLLSGQFRPPVELGGQVSKDATGQLSRLVVRHFLRNLAGRLEDLALVAEATLAVGR